MAINSSIKFKKAEKWDEINTKISRMYKNSYDTVKPGSIKEIEFRVLKKGVDKKINSFLKLEPISCTNPKLREMAKDHISAHSKTKIVKLSMSPYGKHSSYNDEDNFIKSHFLKLTTNESKKIIKKIKALKKKSNEILVFKKKSGGFLKAMQDVEVYKTDTGELYCEANRKNMNTENLRKFSESKDSFDKKFSLSPESRKKELDGLKSFIHKLLHP